MHASSISMYAYVAIQSHVLITHVATCINYLATYKVSKYIAMYVCICCNDYDYISLLTSRKMTMLSLMET